MYIELTFDYYSKVLYIPDGYIYDLKFIQDSFISWISKQSSCIINTPDAQSGFNFNEADFLKFINSEILKNSTEKAYFVSGIPSPKKKFVIRF